jgi:release factor glutamine methyltransferase
MEKNVQNQLVVDQLRKAGCVYAEEEAELLIAAASSSEELVAMVNRRVTGEPLEYVVGWAEFCGLRMTVEPGVFVPRRRSEFLVRLAASKVSKGDVVVDLCCGSGAIGAAIASVVPGINLYAVDIDPAAVRCAKLNVSGIGGTAYEGDLFAPLPPDLIGRVNLIAVNAPYVPTEAIATMPAEARLYEALAALDGGADGLDIQRRISADAGRWLAPGGCLLIETSARQAERSAQLFDHNGLVAQVARDEEYDATVVTALKL